MPSRLIRSRPWRSRDHLHALGQIAVDIIVDGHPAVGAGRIAPIDHVEIDALIEQVADERAVLLQVRHGVAPDEAVDDQDRCPDLGLGERPVVVQGHFVLAPDLVLRRGGDRHVLVAHVLEELRAARDLLAQGRNLGGDLFRPDIDRAHRLAHERVPLRFDARRGLLGRRRPSSRRSSLPADSHAPAIEASCGAWSASTRGARAAIR